MTITNICFVCLCSYLTTRLFLMKKNIRKLTSDFIEAKENLEGEQHVQLSSPDKELEILAAQLNECIEVYFTEQYIHKKAIKEIRNEITNLSHDLRTPITSILGYLDFIIEENLTVEQSESLAIIKRRANDLNCLIEQLYEYVRLENEDYNIELEKIDINKILKEHLLSFYMEFEREAIELELQLPKEEGPVWILGNFNCLTRVLTNLTTNTIKYGEGDVLVSLRCTKIEVMITYRSYRGTLTEYDIMHLFERFYKKDTVRGVARSSGLGLTIAKLYIELMKGKMDARGDDKYLYIAIRLPRQIIL